MSERAVILHPGGALIDPERVDLASLESAAAEFAAGSMAEATRKAYAADLRDFSVWCASAGLQPFPAESRTVRLYLTQLGQSKLATSTIERRAAAIASLHRAADLPNPCARNEVRQVMQGIRNKKGKAPKKKQALTVDLVAQVLRKIRGETALAVRDRALILLAFGAALRRSELVSLRVEDLEFSRKGLLVTLPKSKTDQEGRGQKVAVLHGKLKAPDAVKTWLQFAGITEGYVFPAADRGQAEIKHMNAAQFAKILKARCEAAGLDRDAFSGHSPRRGFATTAGDEGEDLRNTARQMRHVKLETTMGYMEDGELFRNNAGKSFM